MSNCRACSRLCTDTTRSSAASCSCCSAASAKLQSKKLLSGNHFEETYLRLLCYCFHQYFELINRHFCLICRNFNQLYETNCPTAILLANKKIRRQSKVLKTWQTCRVGIRRKVFFAKITKRKVFLSESEWQTSL